MNGFWSRIVSLAVSVLLLILMLPCSLFSTATAASLGDVTGDGVVNMMDVMSVYRHTAGASTISEQSLAVADVTGDGVVNMMDVMTLYRVVSGLMSLPEPVVDTLTPIAPEEYYGRTVLLKENEDYVATYDYLVEELTALNENIILWQEGLTLAEFERVFRYVRDDHPEMFWVSGGYGYQYYTGNDGAFYIYSIQQDYAYSKAQVDAYLDQVETVAAECLDGMTDKTPPADRVKRVHDWLVLRASYDTTYKAPYTHDLRGVMLNKTGVCESYARTFQYLMYRCGIQTIVTFGTASSGEAHMWNVLQLNGDWYHMDVTWNDPVFASDTTGAMKNYISYKYYNITTKQIMSDRTHEAAYSSFDASYQVSYPIPNCVATAENYEIKHSTPLSSFDIAVIAPVIAESILENKQAIFRVEGSYTMAAFKADFENTTKFWAMVDAVNKLLPQDQQLVQPGYSLTLNTTSRLWSVYLRDMSA